ncbi:MAG: hypothetical protein Q9160_006741 [Pyrenula sp. 1 TL-2023]
MFDLFRTPPASQGRLGPIHPSHQNRCNSTRRTIINDVDVLIFAWPSKGGVIILEHVEAVDFDFLGLEPLNPPFARHESQSDEDAFCQRLLLLGAKWWDSEARWRFLKQADELDGRAIEALEEENEPAPTMRERKWVSVGWATGGGLWISEFDTNLWGIEEDHNLVPFDTARLRLARTMDERCQVLRKHFKGRFYKDISDYQGFAFINSWSTKETGEVGVLVKS